MCPTVLPFSGSNLASHPTALIVMMFLIVVFGLGFYWMQDHDEKLHVPLLARQDVVFRPLRDALFERSALGQMLSVLYTPQWSEWQKVLNAFLVTLRDFHLVVAIQWSNPYSNMPGVLRLALLMVWALTMFWSAAMFYATDRQSRWAVAWCVGEADYRQYDDSRFCSDVAMAFVHSLTACLPAYLLMSCMMLIRPRTAEWDSQRASGLMGRVKERAPLWERETVLVAAKAMYDEAQHIRSQFFFSGKERHVDLGVLDEEEHDPDGQAVAGSSPRRSTKVETHKTPKMWSSDLSANPAPFGAKTWSFGNSMGAAASDLRGIEDDVLNEMMARPAGPSMNAPKPRPLPMYTANHNLQHQARPQRPQNGPSAKKVHSDTEVDSMSPDSGQPFIGMVPPIEMDPVPPMDAAESAKAGNLGDYVVIPSPKVASPAEEEEDDDDDVIDEDDEKDVLLHITRGGPDDATPGGPQPAAAAVDEWEHWQPATGTAIDLYAVH